MENLTKHSYNNKFLKKQALTTIALILLLTFTAMTAGTQLLTVQAQTGTGTITGYAFVVAAPNPVGVGQNALINFWVADPLPSAISGIGQSRTGYMVTITKPDNTTETHGPYNSNYEGGRNFYITPTMVGTYHITFNYPQQTIYFQWNNTSNQPLNPQNNYTETASTATTDLIVQQNPVQGVFMVPLPTQYWTRPINAQNYWWSQVSSNWLMGAYNSTNRFFDNNAAFVPEGTLPNSAHVLWTKPEDFGGLAGGIYNNVPYYSGLSYEMFFTPPIIISGRLFYTTTQGEEPRGSGGPQNNLGTVCVDLYTGQEIYHIANVTMSYGQILNFPGVNQAGTFAYLWSGSTLYDAWTGNVVATIANMTSGTATYGKNGEIIIYRLANNNTKDASGNSGYQLTMWNSTRAIESYQPTGTGTTSQDYSWRPFTNYPNPIDGNRGIQWQVPALNVTNYSLTPFLQQGGLFDGNNILAYQSLSNLNLAEGFTNTSSTTGVNITAYDMTTGLQKYTTHIAPAPNMPYVLDGIASFENIWEFNGHLYSFNHFTLQWVAYDIHTGQVMWVSDPLKDSWGYFNQAASLIEAYGLTIAAGFDGYAYAWNSTTGQLVWDYYAGDSGTLNPYGHYTFYDGINVCDGKVILLPNEHGSGIEPLYQNLTTIVLDATTGKLVWGTLGYFEHPVFADGILLSHNNYDGQIYAFGKGPSATTIEAPLAAINKGSSLVIRGTVTDQSVGALARAKTTGAAYIPAMSDADQSQWMEYVYMQQPIPMNATGVPVQLQAVDPSGAILDLGGVTSDLSGSYASMWTPPTTGLYTIIATFGGSNSYYGSYAETHIAVQSAPSASTAATPTPTTTTPPPTATLTPTISPSIQPPPPGVTDNTALYVGIAAVVIIAVALAAAVGLRRRK